MEESVRIPASENELEGILAYPEEGDPDMTVLLLAPHPHLGGNMENNLVRHLARQFASEGCATLRFNYRGVGNSTIELPDDLSLFDFWAQLEKEKRYEELLPDTVNAGRFLHQAAPLAKKRMLIGYSLGAILAMGLAQEIPFSNVAGISPPILKAPVGLLAEKSRASLLFIGGEKDFAFDPDIFERMLDAADCRAPLKRIADCDHFYRGREEEVYQVLAEWRRTSL